MSVIVPTFNRSHTLPAALDSVQQQTLPAAEVIVIDDGSNDNTKELVQEKYPWVKLIEQANHGVSHARNRGIEMATQPWIALLDSDDRWLAHKLRNQLSAIHESPELLLCHCDEIWIRHGKRVNAMNKHKKRGGHIFSHCLPLCAISPSAAMIHQDLFNEVGLFDEQLPACEDYDMWLRICAKHAVLYLDEALLEKTGGHNDQLSKKHWGMDRFRLIALAKQLRSGALSREQYAEAKAVFQQKYKILYQGAVKHNNQELKQTLEHEYPDLLAELPAE